MNKEEKREQERADRLKRAKDLIGEMEKELAQHKSPKTVLVQMRKSALTDLRGELTELAELIGTKRHRLVFIGQVFVGKTTAICHLVGLTADREKKKANKAGVEKQIPVVEDLMATGSGVYNALRSDRYSRRKHGIRDRSLPS